MGGSAQADHQIRLRGGAVDPHRGVMGRGAQINQILRLTVVVLHPDPVIDPVGNQRPQLLLIPAGVGAVGHDNGEVFRPDAALRP